MLLPSSSARPCAEDSVQELFFLQLRLPLPMAFDRFRAFLLRQGQETAGLDRSEFLYQDINRFRNKLLFVGKDAGFHFRSSAIVNSTGFIAVTVTFSLRHFLTNLSSHSRLSSASLIALASSKCTGERPPGHIAPLAGLEGSSNRHWSQVGCASGFGHRRGDKAYKCQDRFFSGSDAPCRPL